MKISKDIPLYIIIVLPYLYLAYLWVDLPAEVPLHWNTDGDIDKYVDKEILLFIPCLLPLIIYIIFLIASSIDPKNRLKKMGKKLYSLKVSIVLIVSILSLYILYLSKGSSLDKTNYLILFVGILYAVFGNYFKALKPNYFIGIRTPWTLEDERVWYATHKMAGMLWFISGLLVVIFSLILKRNINIRIFILLTAIIVLVPTVFSYLKFKRLKNKHH